MSHQMATAQTVHIPDPGLRAALELALGKEAGDDITRADMESLESLQASRCRFIRLKDTNNWGIPSRWICESPNDTFGPAIKKLTGLEYATNLTELHLGRNQISDVSPLQNLTTLTYLDLGANWRISDVTPLRNLVNLTFLNLRGNGISDVSSLSGLTKLVDLDLHFNRISDITSLRNLKNLIFLGLRGNEISDVSPLENLTNLTHLSLRDNQIVDVSVLQNFTNMTGMDLQSNRISDISPLNTLTELTQVATYRHKVVLYWLR